MSAESSVAHKRSECESTRKALSAAASQIGAKAEHLAAVERRLNAAKVGIASEKDDVSVSDQIQEQRRVIAECDVAIHRIEKNSTRLRSQQRTLQHQIQQTSREITDLTARRGGALQVQSTAESALRALEFDPQHQRALADEREELGNRAAILRDSVDRAERQLVGIEFQFTPPPGFNPSEVHGPLARLIRVRDASYNAAIETTAGGKLYHIVVEFESTAGRLLSEGRLRRHVTLIPLDRIESRKIPANTVQAARRLAPSAHLAQDLLAYDRRHEPAVQFAFGQVCICDTLDEAQALAFNRQFRIKSVTKAGDVYDPIGTLSGGGRAEGASILTKIMDYEKMIEERRGIQQRLHELDRELQALEDAGNRYRQLSQECEIAAHELKLADDALRQSACQTLQEQLDRIASDLAGNANALQQAVEKKKVAVVEHEQLQRTQADWEVRQNVELGKLENQLRKAQNDLERVTAEKNQLETTIETVNMELEELTGEFEKCQAQIAECQTGIEKNQKLEEDSARELERATIEKDQRERDLATHKKALSETADLLAAAIEREEQLQAEASQQVQLKKQWEQQISQYKEERQTTKRRIRAMQNDYPWIAREERFFGVPHTDFDFKLYDPDTARLELEDLRDKRNHLEFHVNKRAVTMCETAERELASLASKRDIVELEKAKIHRVIAELEAKTRVAIELTHQKVDRELNDIVMQVFPGSIARLEPQKEEGVYVGLELKVAFSQVHKGLQELSGGQRSLIALALVLALLKFKPAPFYILDEIDAALDLNHTQNIGRMLRQSFRSAQFIIVSLKEGMWNNANVLFRTSFRDSNSQVQRTVNHPT